MIARLERLRNHSALSVIRLQPGSGRRVRRTELPGDHGRQTGGLDRRNEIVWARSIDPNPAGFNADVKSGLTPLIDSTWRRLPPFWTYAA
jgi:hypothetical protein